MKTAAGSTFAGQLRTLREAAGFTQGELATIAGLSEHAVSALERGERRRPHVETVRALAAALDLPPPARDALMGSARPPVQVPAADELVGARLPVAPTPLIGRDAEVTVLRGWLADPAARLVTLTGPGGAGKTRLAIEVARPLERDPARVVFVSLAAIRDPALVGPAIAEALGLDVAAADLVQRARAACGDRPTLIVLDNFEQVLDAAPLAADLLTSITSLRLLVTSRAPLRIRGEREFVVGPLECQVPSKTAPSSGLACVAAMRLFVDRVRDVQPDFRLTAANAATVRAICRRIDALPLAIELTAPWIKVLPPEELLRRLEQDVLLPAVGARDLPERQRTMNAAVGWSYQLLDPDEQRAFRRFGVLQGAFSIEAAASVLADDGSASVRDGEALRLTAALIDKSLLVRSADASTGTASPLFSMLETVRAYAALELAASGERDAALHALARYCIRQGALAASGLVGPEQAEWLYRVRNDLENHRSAMSWLIARGQLVEAADIALALKYFWVMRGRAAEGLRWYERILNAPEPAAGAELRALTGAAVMWFSQGKLDAARAALDRARPLARIAQEAAIGAEADYTSGHVERAAGDLRTARDRFARSLAGFRALDDVPGAGKALTGMAAVAVAAGDVEGAERLLDEAQAVLRQAGPWFLCFGLWMRAVLAIRRGAPDEAIAWIGECLTRVRTLNDKFAFMYALLPLAAAAVLKGKNAWAARILGVRDAVAVRTGSMLEDGSFQALRTQAEREARAQLGPARWARAYEAGRCTSIDRLLRDIATHNLAAAARRTDQPAGTPGAGDPLQLRRPLAGAVRS